MADRENSPTDTRDQAVQIKEAWSNMGATTTFGDMTVAELEAAISRLDTLASTITQYEDRLMSARNEYRTQRHQLWDIVKRARYGVRAKYGDDSDQYERFGGTRLSDRQRRKPAKTTTSV